MLFHGVNSTPPSNDKKERSTNTGSEDDNGESALDDPTNISVGLSAMSLSRSDDLCRRSIGTFSRSTGRQQLVMHSAMSLSRSAASDDICKQCIGTFPLPVPHQRANQNSINQIPPSVPHQLAGVSSENDNNMELALMAVAPATPVKNDERLIGQ